MNSRRVFCEFLTDSRKDRHSGPRDTVAGLRGAAAPCRPSRDPATCRGTRGGVRAPARRHGDDLRLRSHRAARGVSADRVRRVGGPDHRGIGSSDSAIRLRCPLRVTGRRQPSPRRVSIVRRHRRRRLRRWRRSLPDPVRRQRPSRGLLRRRGRGHLLGAVPRMLHRTNSLIRSTSQSNSPERKGTPWPKARLRTPKSEK